MANLPLKDKDYDLISVVYHASQGVEICRQDTSDAKSDGDQDAAQYFEEVAQNYTNLITKGKDLLKQRL
jgi:hypothetical protein